MISTVLYFYTHYETDFMMFWRRISKFQKNIKFKENIKILDKTVSLVFIGSTSISIAFGRTEFVLFVVPITAGVRFGKATVKEKASDFSENKTEFFRENYTFSKNTVQKFRHIYQRKKTDQAQYEKFTVFHNQNKKASRALCNKTEKEKK